MPIIHAYIITQDNGSAPCAPCAPDNLLTLAICKPVIRKRAKPGDIIVGISGATIADPKQGQGYPKHAVIYAAVVDRVMPWEQYATGGFNGRMDCIYRCEAVDGGFRRKGGAMVHVEFEEKKVESRKKKAESSEQKAKPNKKKPKPKSHKEKDTSSPVLLSRNFRYFGENAIPLSTLSLFPTFEKLRQMTRGHRVFNSVEPDHEEIFKEFEMLFQILWQKPTSHTISVAAALACLREPRCKRWEGGGQSYWIKRAGGLRSECGTTPKRPGGVGTTVPVRRTGRVTKGGCC